MFPFSNLGPLVGKKSQGLRLRAEGLRSAWLLSFPLGTYQPSGSRSSALTAPIVYQVSVSVSSCQPRPLVALRSGGGHGTARIGKEAAPSATPIPLQDVLGVVDNGGTMCLKDEFDDKVLYDEGRYFGLRSQDNPFYSLVFS